MAGTAYKLLFTVELLHEYFLNKVCEDVRILPSADTLESFSKYGLLYKNVSNKLFVLVKCDKDDNTPIKPIPGNEMFRFDVLVDNYRFYNFTNLGIPPEKLDPVVTRPYVYLFKSLTDNNPDEKKYLTVPAPEYVLGQFIEGTIVESDDKLFEFVFNIENEDEAGDIDAPTGDIGAGANSYKLAAAGNPVTYIGTVADYFWYERGDVVDMSFVSAADVLPLGRSAFNFKLDTASNMAVYSIKAFNNATRAFDITVVQPSVENYTENVEVVRVPLTALKSGRYLIEVNGVEKEIYHEASFAPGNRLGVIEIFAKVASGANDYNLFHHTSGAILSPLFTIHFANKLVYWKYNFHEETDMDYACYYNIAFETFDTVEQTPGREVKYTHSKLKIPLLNKSLATNDKQPLAATGPPPIATEDKRKLATAQVEMLVPLVTDDGQFVKHLTSENFSNLK